MILEVSAVARSVVTIPVAVHGHSQW